LYVGSSQVWTQTLRREDRVVREEPVRRAAALGDTAFVLTILAAVDFAAVLFPFRLCFAVVTANAPFVASPMAMATARTRATGEEYRFMNFFGAND
jgi:hypothetical protein